VQSSDPVPLRLPVQDPTIGMRAAIKCSLPKRPAWAIIFIASGSSSKHDKHYLNFRFGLDGAGRTLAQP
jgi:hypothetical protein